MEDFEGVEGLDICHKYGQEIFQCEAQGGEHRVTPSAGCPDPGACDSPRPPPNQ